MMVVPIAEESLRWAQQSLCTAETVLAFTLLIVVVTTIARYRSSMNNPAGKSLPSPWALPVIGNLHQLSLHGSAYRSLAFLSSRYGPLMKVRMGSVEHLVVASADAAREVMKDNDLSFSSRPNLTAADRLLYKSRDVAASPYGEHWRQARRLCVVHLLTAARLRQLRWAREGQVAALLQKVEAAGGEEINISVMLLMLASNITSLVALGKGYWDEGDGLSEDSTGRKVRELIEEFLKLMSFFNIADVMPGLAWVNWLNGFERRAAKCAKGMDEVLEAEIHERIQMRKQGKGSVAEPSVDENNVGVSFLDILLSLEEASDETDSLFDRDTIKSLVLDMILAGTHTTFTAMDWAMTELMRHPAVYTKLTQEIRSTSSAGRNKTLVHEDDIQRMPYLHCVIKEVLRMHPPAPLLVPRETINDVQVMGYHLPKGTKTIINAWAIHHDPKVWDRPGEFLPERFANSSVDFKGFDFELIPFGSGRRGCPGLLFAIQIIHLTLANLLCYYDWELPEGMNADDVDMSEASVMSKTRKYSLTLKAKTAPIVEA